jgi:DNA-binding MarR family transcriptional regulator
MAWAMNAIAFGAKRTFHSFLRLTRRGFALVGLTAARFDLMNVVFGDLRSPESHGILQKDLPRNLGVTKGVVSRMLRSLEKLSLVTRERPKRDLRQRLVKLTPAGVTILRAAWSLLVRAVRRLTYEAICFGRGRRPEERWIDMAELESYLGRLRRDFGDTATLYYRWGHPDD